MYVDVREMKGKGRRGCNQFTTLTTAALQQAARLCSDSQCHRDSQAAIRLGNGSVTKFGVTVMPTLLLDLLSVKTALMFTFCDTSIESHPI